ncbi:MAG: hybrid sensor histidine kinase/response regulator, partial [Parabacteroides sp.]|nr:hybrid sensor histidine kinase/response regulator [Parabacteroides sp.]
MKTVYFIFLLCFLYPARQAGAHNLRQLSNRDGLSNSSVTCLYQDGERFLWVGTYDGLNLYDSRDIYVYKPDINNRNSLSSNVIRDVIETDSGYLWVNTKGGLNKLSQRNNSIEEYYPGFGEKSYIAKDRNAGLYVFSRPNTLSFYVKARHTFVHFPIYQETAYDNVSGFIVDPHDTIWINHRGKLEKYTLSGKNPDALQVVHHPDFAHPYAITYVFYDKGEIIFVDTEGNLYHKNTGGLHFIKNLKQLIREHGEIGSIIFDNRDVLIGFKTNGLVRLIAERAYEPEKFDIDCGVFSLLKDERQDIVWIGTDGQGVYAWTKDKYTFTNLPLRQLPVRKKRPVRAVYADRFNTLWIGTKDNGIIRIKEYDTAREYPATNTSHFTVRDGLTNNAVFALTPSKAYPVLWIGSDGPGLNYYSYADHRIHTLTGPAETPVSHVHAISKTDDSSVWLGAGNTLLKIRVQPDGQDLKAGSIRPFHFKVPHKQQYNQIYAIYPENDSIIWVGIRGNGVIRFNTHTEESHFLSFDKEGIAPMSDVLCVYCDRNKTTWLGTSYGLIKLNFSPGGEYTFENFNENDGLPNNTIHGIAGDRQGHLWLSSNTGLILFDPHKNTFRNFNHKTGLEITEFSDNAYFQDSTANRYFFGGIDGVVWIKNENGTEKKPFTPAILFTKLRIFNKEYAVSDFEERKSGAQTILLNHNQNFFAVSFVAMDFINGENGRYSYKLENFSDVWMDIRSNEALFTNIPPGKYVLK